MLEKELLPEFSSLYKTKKKSSFREEYKEYKKKKITELNGKKVIVDDFVFTNSKINKDEEAVYIFVTDFDGNKYMIITSSSVIMDELKTVKEKGIKKFVGTICTDNKYYTFL